jgi:parallel beta-helix repeat protein
MDSASLFHSLNKRGPRRFYRRVAGATLAVSVLGGIAARAVDLSGQAPAPPTNVRISVNASSRGTQATITCAAGAVNISPGTNIQTVVNAYPGKTTFCIKAGIHNITYQTTPKSGDIFVGEYGAILDGSAYVTTNLDTSAFRALNQDIDDVTIRNLVIRHMPGNAISAFYWMSDRWTIDHNELSYNKKAGVNVPNNSVVSNNYIHDNVGNLQSTIANENGGGYIVYKSTNVLFVDNEIAYNGPEQKSSQSSNVTFRGNYVHHNVGQGIWFDGDNPGSVVEQNLLEDNGLISILYEISSQGLIRNNTIRRSGWQGISLVTSKDMEVYGNTIEDSGRGIGLYLYCPAPIGGGTTGWDLANDYIHDNVIKVGTNSDAFSNSFLYSTCTAEQVAPYLNGSKNNRFVHNQYFVPSTAGKYWQWADMTMRTWSEWQALGQDTTGSLRPASEFLSPSF